MRILRTFKGFFNQNRKYSLTFSKKKLSIAISRQSLILANGHYEDDARGVADFAVWVIIDEYARVIDNVAVRFDLEPR